MHLWTSYTSSESKYELLFRTDLTFVCSGTLLVIRPGGFLLKSPYLPSLEAAHQVLNVTKGMFILFFHIYKVLHREFISQGGKL